MYFLPEARGIGAAASPEDAATAFANLLQDSLKNAPEDPRAALLAKLLDDPRYEVDERHVVFLCRGERGGHKARFR